jgi:hypothetical protein
MVYDSKRDRMIIGGVAGGYRKKSNGSFLAFDFTTKAVTTVTPLNAALNRTRSAREMAYVEHADWILMGETIRVGGRKIGTVYTRVYDCAENTMFLLKAGPVGTGHSAGWMYDAKRKLVYVFNYRGQGWAMRIDPGSAELLEEIPE